MTDIGIISDLIKNVETLESSISKLKNELAKEKKLNKELLSSNSWKLLAPARKLKNVFKK